MSSDSRSRYRPVREITLFTLVVVLLYVVMAFSHTWKPLLGLDLQGGTYVTLTAKSSNGKVSAESLEQARQVIEKRVDGMGVSEATVTTQGGDQIVVSAPGSNQDALVEQVGKTAQLEFRQVFAASPVVSESEDAPVGLPPAAKAAAKERPASSNQILGIDNVLAWSPSQDDLAEFEAYQCGDPVRSFPDQALITCDQSNGNKYLLGPVAIEGKWISDAQAGIPSGQLSWVVSLNLKDEAKDWFGKLTESAFGKTGQPQNRIAIVLDDSVVSAPNVNAKIDSGVAEITGSFTQEEAHNLANVLRYGALPLSFESSDVQNISATLGGEQLTGGLIAAAIGLALVLVFSLFYYRGLSIIVVGSLAAATAMTYAMLCLLGTSMGVVLTLPGLAGAVVSIGTTADSFIIYFERIRDEIRNGKSLRTAIESGWRKARWTITISDAVQLLSAIVLFLLAAGNVQGFAFILGMTTIMDLVIVFFFTHPLMSLLGKTRFFGNGHKFSGLSAEHMGVSLSSLMGRRPSNRKVSAKQVSA